DIHGRLETAYKDALVNPDSTEVEEDAFPESDDAFIMISAMISSDSEIWVWSILRCPTSYFLERANRSLNSKKYPSKDTNVNRRSRYAPPPPWSQVNDPDCQIGLLRDFFRNKMEESNGKLIEDDFLPAKQRNQQRPRVPPTGKIPPQPKRQPKLQLMAAALAEKKKKKERDAQMAEEKERAKRLKAEEQAKEAKKAEAAKKAAIENKKKKVTVKTGKVKTPQPDVTVTPVPKKHELEDGSDSELVPLAQRKKRRVEATNSRVGNKR
ncbi:2887_t:CDS:2, partial [Acaulospora colombiana]